MCSTLSVSSFIDRSLNEYTVDIIADFHFKHSKHSSGAVLEYGVSYWDLRGARQRNRLRQSAAIRKVAGSNPDGIFH